MINVIEDLEISELKDTKFIHPVKVTYNNMRLRPCSQTQAFFTAARHAHHGHVFTGGNKGTYPFHEEFVVIDQQNTALLLHTKAPLQR